MIALLPLPPSVPLPLSACSKAVGYRFGKHLGRGVPLAIRNLRGAAEGDEELREYCLQVTAACSWVRSTLLTAISPLCWRFAAPPDCTTLLVCTASVKAQVPLGST